MDIANASLLARRVAADRGWAWWHAAWLVFIRNAGMWIVLALAMLVVFAVLGRLALFGRLVALLLLPVFMGGWMLTVRRVEPAGVPVLADVFAGFQQRRLVPLLVLGVVLVASIAAVGLTFSVLGMGAAFGLAGGALAYSVLGLLASLGVMLLALVAVALLSVMVGMALWFAPALVVLQGLAPVDALKASFLAQLKNWRAFLLYSAVYLVAALLATVPFGLGWLVLVPVGMTTLYVSYTEVFGS